MSLISYPQSLSAEGSLSDYQHIKYFYDELSSGNKDINLSYLLVQSSLSANNITENVKLLLYPINLIGGNIDNNNCNYTLENKNILAKNYKNSILIVYSIDATFNCQLLKSIQYSNDLWKWILIGNEGESW